MLSVLGVDVDDQLLELWRDWLAPDPQPFVVEGDAARGAEVVPIAPELRDTYTLWNVHSPYGLRWLHEDEFHAMPRPERAALVRSQVRAGRGAVPTVRRWSDLLGADAIRSQADGHRFVWWPSLLPADDRALLVRVVANGEHPSHHRAVAEETWRGCSTLLPGARQLAGTFPASSGPNCFGTVMAAAGVTEVADEWVLQEHFADWLRARCRPGGADREVGTVLAWFAGDGRPVHAAIALGDGWAMEKPSQCWWTPRTVMPVDDIRRINRTPGQRLRRYRLQ